MGPASRPPRRGSELAAYVRWWSSRSQARSLMSSRSWARRSSGLWPRGPPGVVVDLSAVSGAEPDAVEALAMAGRHVRDWPAIPVAVACADQQVRDALAAHPL